MSTLRIVTYCVIVGVLLTQSGFDLVQTISIIAAAQLTAWSQQ